MNASVGTEHVKLSDNSVIKLKILIVDVKEAGFSPFGGVQFDVKVVGGISTEFVPEEVKKLVIDKPPAPPEPPVDGWEILDIVEQNPAVAEETIKSSKGEFVVKVVAEAVMASRNTLYRVPPGEPIYTLSWVFKVSWKPKK